MKVRDELPTYERRPTVGWYAGQSIGAIGCLTHLFGINLIRLLAYAYLLAQLWITVLATVASKPLPMRQLGLAVLLLIGAWLIRPRRQQQDAAKPEQWTPKEIAFATAYAQGDTTQYAEQVMVEYGATTSGQAVLVAPHVRFAHQLTTGGSGTGKSKFLATQAVQSAIVGNSLGLLDPHEELAADVLQSGADVLATKGCVVLWPDGPSRTIIPWNPLDTSLVAPWQAADTVVAAVKRVWQLSDANTYILDVLKHTCLALAGSGWTLLEGSRFLTDEAFRTYVTATANIPDVTAWVSAFDAMPLRERIGLSQTTLVRLNRLRANPWIAALFGCGVTNVQYCTARSAADLPITPSSNLLQAINRGTHVFAVVPKRIYGEDQYVVAGLLQSAFLSAALLRLPNDPAMPQTELILDEAAAYCTGEGLGALLAQARKYKLSATLAMQGIHQAEETLQAELRTNTAIKTIFGTDHPDEATAAAQMLYGYDPSMVKADMRQNTKVGEDRRPVGQLTFYSPLEQAAFHTSQVLNLPKRTYLLKVRGEGDPRTVVTPDYAPRYDLPTAYRVATAQHIVRSTTLDTVEAELRWRHNWLEHQGYNRQSKSGQRDAPPILGNELRVHAAGAAASSGVGCNPADDHTVTTARVHADTESPAFV